MISHWDEVRTWRGERGHIAGTWSSLTGRSSQSVGLKRIQVDPGKWSMPLHLDGAEEEIFLRPRRLQPLVQWEGEGEPSGYEVRTGDCIVHLALENAHTLRAGPDGLDVLAFGQRAYARTGRRVLLPAVAEDPLQRPRARRARRGATRLLGRGGLGALGG